MLGVHHHHSSTTGVSKVHLPSSVPHIDCRF